MAGKIDIWRGSAGTGSATKFNADEAVDSWMHKKGFFVASKFGTPRMDEPSVPSYLLAGQSASSSPKFTAGEQIGFASQAIGAVLGNIAQNRSNKLQARALREQAGLFDVQAGIYDRGAAMYASQAAGAAAIGENNATNLRLAAAQLDYYEQLRLREATLEARRRIGQGRAGFAANGFLVDSGAAAMWEQDEAADAALERLDIMQQFEDQSWTYRTQANKAEAEGYAAAAQQAAGAAQAAGQAYALRIQAESARAQAARLKKKKSWGATIGVILGGVVGGVATGGTGVAAGAALGGSLGGVYDASRS